MLFEKTKTQVVILLCLILQSFYVSFAVGDDRLSESDHQILASECHKVEGAGRAYAYFPATIVAIDSGGANIRQIIRTEFTIENGDNNGWGEAKKITKYHYVECIWFEVAKGKYEIPPYFTLDYRAPGKLPIMRTLILQNYYSLDDGQWYTEIKHHIFNGKDRKSTYVNDSTYFLDQAINEYKSRKPINLNVWEESSQ